MLLAIGLHVWEIFQQPRGFFYQRVRLKNTTMASQHLPKKDHHVYHVCQLSRHILDGQNGPPLNGYCPSQPWRRQGALWAGAAMGEGMAPGAMISWDGNGPGFSVPFLKDGENGGRGSYS